ncbi:unnamed protein product, partial [Rotaria sp. Silwood2]
NKCASFIISYSIGSTTTITETCIKYFSIFHSQARACGSNFRNSRALNGCYSTKVNFTVDNFLLRIEKLVVLHLIKYIEQSNNQENRLLFRVYHKYKKDDLFPLQNIINTDDLNIEEIILKANKEVQEHSCILKMSTLLKQNHASELSDSNTNIINYVKTNKMNDRSKLDAGYDSDVDKITSMEEDENYSDNKQNQSCDSEMSDDD